MGAPRRIRKLAGNLASSLNLSDAVFGAACKTFEEQLVLFWAVRQIALDESHLASVVASSAGKTSPHRTVQDKESQLGQDC